MKALFSYDPNQSTLKDCVRFRIGDVDEKPEWFLADQEINAVLGRYVGNFDEACAQCAEALGAKLLQRADEVQQRNLRRRYQSRATNAFALADRIRNLAQPLPTDPPNPGASSAHIRASDHRQGCALRQYERETLGHELPQLYGGFVSGIDND